MDAINENRNVNDLLLGSSGQSPSNAGQCLRNSQKRKLAEDCSIVERQPEEKRRARTPFAVRSIGQPSSSSSANRQDHPKDDEAVSNCRAKRFKNSGLDRSSCTTSKLSSSSEIPLISKSHFKKRVLKSYSNKKLLKSKRRRSFSKQILNLNNLSFDTQSAYRFKFEQIIKNVFEKINSCSLEDEYQLDSDDGDILDLNQLFHFGNDSNLDSVLDDNLIHSLKASYLGRGSFGKVFKTRLEQKCYAIKIGLSNSFYGCTGEQHALILNEHPNVVKTHHILKLKLANDEQLAKQRKAADEDFPMFMSTKISYYTMKHIIDLNILKLVDLFPKHKLYSTLNVIIMEFAGDFSLQQLIDDAKNQRITKERRIHFAKQIADALVYLKNKSIAHLDLKPANIMIRKNDDLLKLIDFGCSKKCYLQLDAERIDLGPRFKPEPVKFEPLPSFSVNGLPKFAADADKENRNDSAKPSAINKYLSLENTIVSSLIKSGKKIGQNHCNIGTISHTAPEIFRHESVKNIFQADVYSFSIILWQLVTREMPYSGDNIHSIIYRVASGKLRPKFDPLFHLEEKNYYDLTVKMWNNLPEHRPSIELVFQTLNRWF